jgi:hypothetical protein
LSVGSKGLTEGLKVTDPVFGINMHVLILV